MGASTILIIDLVESRLNVAKSVGADLTLKIEKTDSEEEILKKIKALLPNDPNISIDCSGVEMTNRLSILATRSGGVVVLVGQGPLSVSVPLVNALNREVDIRGSSRYCNDYQTALALISSGKYNVKQLVTHHFDITETKDAFHTSRHGLGEAIKVMIHVQPRDKNNPKKF